MYNTSDYRADSRNHDQGAEYRRAAQEVRDFEDFGLTPLTSRENTPRLELGISMSENNGNTLPWTGIPLNLKESSQSWFVDETDCEQPTDTNGSINQIPDGGSDCDEKRVENESMNYEKLTLQELAKHCNLPPNTPSFQLPWALHENTQHSGQSVDLEAYTTSENDPNEIVRSVLCDTSQCDIEQANRTILSGDNHLLSPQPKIEPSSQLRYILTPDSSSRPFLISEPKVALPTCTSPMILRESNSFSERTCSTASEPPVVANHLINFSLLKKETESVHSQHHHKRSPIQRDPHISEEITLPLYADCFTNYRLDAAKRRRIKQSIRKARRSEDVPKGKTGTGKQGRKLQTKRNRAISHITNQILEKPLSPQNSSTSSLSETDTLKQANTIAKDIPDRLTAAASSSSAENLLSTACGRVIKLKKPANKGRKSPATVYLLQEQSQQRQRQRNREAGERGRTRKKQQAIHLEQSDYTLREEKNNCERRFKELEELVREVEQEARAYAGKDNGQGVRKVLNAVNESLETIQSCKESCLQIFGKAPKSPEEELKGDK